MLSSGMTSNSIFLLALVLPALLLLLLLLLLPSTLIGYASSSLFLEWRECVRLGRGAGAVIARATFASESGAGFDAAVGVRDAAAAEGGG